jgi:ADP-ribose pyrophosphatase YjhB (NUDIX family)
MNPPRLRPAVRAIIVDPDDQILLVRFDFEGRAVWACPGGGIENGEADAAAIRRELDEEVGLTSFELGPCVWTREHVIPIFGGRWDGQQERFYVVRAPAFEPRPRFSPEQLADEYLVDMRWWTAEELRAADVTFAPRRLPALLRDLLAAGAPATPIDAGV